MRPPSRLSGADSGLNRSSPPAHEMACPTDRPPMSFISRVLFESTLSLAVLSFLLLAIILLARTRWESVAARRYALPITLGVIVLLFVAQSLVVTERERILSALDVFIKAVESENIAAIRTAISDDYEMENMTADDFVAYTARFLEAWNIRDVRYRRRDVVVEGRTATMILGLTATAGQKKQVGQTHVGVWKLGGVRENASWKIVSVKPKMIDGQRLDSYKQLPIPR